MKIASALLFLFMCFNCSAQHKRFHGIWEGKINAGIDLRLVFEFKNSETGSLLARLTSPDQTPTPVKLDSAWVKADSIFATAAKFRISFSGLLRDDSTIDGEFIQGKPFHLLLKKVEKISSLNRPQTPVAPFVYNSEDVSYSDKKTNITYAGTITWPKMETNGNRLQSLRYPAVILISGSGPQDRDETLFGHKPFAVIADNLTRLGFSVLRVDDRGVGKSSGKFGTATTADFADDVEAGLEFLKTHVNVDSNRIGMIGHSEGGMIAPLVASRRKDVQFIVLLAGPGVPIVQLMAEQSEAVAKSAGSTAAFARAGNELYTLSAVEINKHADSLTTIKNLRGSLDNWIGQQPGNIITGFHLSTTADKETFLQAQLDAFKGPWYKYFLSFDPTIYLQQLRCDVLALNGSKDIQVIPASNLAGIQASLKKSHSQNFEVKEIPGLNHLFQTCKTCNTREYGELEETFSPVALQIMDDWLLKELRRLEHKNK